MIRRTNDSSVHCWNVIFLNDIDMNDDVLDGIMKQTKIIRINKYKVNQIRYLRLYNLDRHGYNVRSS